MYKIILILVPIITFYLFIDIYKKIIESNNNNIIKNLEEYAEKEKIEQQESEIHGQKSAKQNRRSKKARVYNS